MREEGGAQQWHREVVTSEVDRALRDLRERSVLDDFYLAGGTGLALQLGHRRSVDLDFFSTDMFDEELLIRKLLGLAGFSVVGKDSSTLHAGIGRVKASFLGYPYPVIFPFLSFADVNVADPRDIACMKISAIAGRGTRRDFVDLYFVSKSHGLQPLLELFRRKFAKADYSKIHILKSLTYFHDAEEDPMPDMLADLSWDEVKNFFRSVVPSLV